MAVNEKKLHKGRGAISNPASRFDPHVSEPVDDGWNEVESADISSSAPKTKFFPDQTRNIIATNKSPDIPFDRSINPYKGCEHGCVYCYARPTHAFLGLSPGLDFETRIFYKTEPAARLSEALERRGYKVRPIAMGTNTDPYQPGERQLGITREILKTLLRYRHPVTLVTKSTLILRDLDILAELATLGLVQVSVSVTTLNNGLKTALEPRTAGPRARLRVLDSLHQARIPVGAMIAPVIPCINDNELEDIVAAVSKAGASTVGYILLRLPLEVEDLFVEWLQQHYPNRADHVMSHIRAMRGGVAYRAEWGTRMRGQGTYADLLARRFELATKRAGLGTDLSVPLRTDLFRPTNDQLSLFGNP